MTEVKNFIVKSGIILILVSRLSSCVEGPSGSIDGTFLAFHKKKYVKRL